MLVDDGSTTFGTPLAQAPPQAFGPGTVPGAGVQPAVPAWDPYANPATQPAVPYSPYAPSPFAPPPPTGPRPLYPDGLSGPAPPSGDWWGQLQQPMRFLQEVRLRDAFLFSSGGDQSLTVDDFETSATFAFPFLYDKAPFLITPGFAMHFFGGPKTTATDPADLPPRTYDAFLDGAWQPQLNPWLSANLGVRVGVYTDFNTFTTRSIRIMGRGLGVIALTQDLQFAIGVVYLDRNRVKLLPAGGFVWTPSPDARYEILFPNPKLARKFGTIATTEVWWYLAGEYGDGAWTVERAAGFSDSVDYNDIRVYLGAEGYTQRNLKVSIEVGYVFRREIIYRSGMPEKFVPDDTVMIRGGLAY